MLQRFGVENNSKKFHACLKTVYGPSSSAMAPVRSADGTLLMEKNDIVQRWCDHFSQLLNRPSQIDQQIIQDMPQRPFLASLDDPPKVEGTEKAIKQLQAGNAPGPDGIPRVWGVRAITLRTKLAVAQSWQYIEQLSLHLCAMVVRHGRCTGNS